jgi:protein-tyrosine phosphatase
MFAFMESINREFVHSQAGHFADMFARILDDGAARVLLHCSAGKDRTGFAAALLLLALGVPRPLVMRDYLLSRHYFHPAQQLAQVRSKYGIGHLDDAVILPLLSVEEAYLGAALAAVDAAGGVDAYLQQELGVGPAERAQLAARFLEGAPG